VLSRARVCVNIPGKAAFLANTLREESKAPRAYMKYLTNCVEIFVSTPGAHLVESLARGKHRENIEGEVGQKIPPTNGAKTLPNRPFDPHTREPGFFFSNINI